MTTLLPRVGRWSLFAVFALGLLFQMGCGESAPPDNPEERAKSKAAIKEVNDAATKKKSGLNIKGKVSE